MLICEQETLKIFSTKILVFIMFVIMIIILNLVDGQRLVQRPCNNNTYREVDRMIARMSEFGNPENRFPETLEELKSRCE